jgi:hypothetical protein
LIIHHILHNDKHPELDAYRGVSTTLCSAALAASSNKQLHRNKFRCAQFAR